MTPDLESKANDPLDSRTRSARHPSPSIHQRRHNN